MKLSVVVAVFNEARTLQTALSRILLQEVPGLEKELVIIESNSTDGSRAIVAQFAEDANRAAPGTVRVIYQDAPRGKGNAVRAGLAQASGEIVLIQDGDLEYSTEDYPALVQPILDGKTSFVLGSRHLSAGNWKIRKFEESAAKALLLNFGGRVFHALFNVIYSQKLTDPTTMYKVFRTECVRGLNFTANRFDFDFELVAKIIRRGYTPMEVPVSYTSRGFDDGKKVRIFLDPITWLVAIARYRFSRLETTGDRVDLPDTQSVDEWRGGADPPR